MKSTDPPQFSIAEIFNSISDNISLELFKIIAAENKKGNLSLPDAKNKITRKQYYSRMNKLTRGGLTKRSKGKYNLTSLGKVIHYNLIIIENAYRIQWKLKALDSLESSDIPSEGRMKVVDSLIEDQTIREILYASSSKTKKYCHSSMTQEQTPSSIRVPR
jgi:hypothetical protein